MVAAASEEASTNVQSVASATEQMASSIHEIGRQVQDSARMAGDAVHEARKTNDRVSELSKAAARIGDVVELINTIAGQTNLLALNATIEAAPRRRSWPRFRGRGIRGQGTGGADRQGDRRDRPADQWHPGGRPRDSVNAIREISGTIERLSEISSAIAAAVEEQGAATQEISRNVQQAAQGTPAGLFKHHRCAAWRRRDRAGLVAGAVGGTVAVGRQQSPQARSRQIPEFGKGGLRDASRLIPDFRRAQKSSSGPGAACRRSQA